MKPRIFGASFLLAAWVTTLVTKAAFGTTLAEAARYYFSPPAATSGGAGITAAVVIAFALAIAIELALVAHFTLPHKQEMEATRVELPCTIGARKQKRRDV
jgi:hypothetical protein